MRSVATLPAAGALATLWFASSFAQVGAPLRLAVNMTTIESAPLLVAAGGVPEARVQVTSGGIPRLLAREVDAATNSSTQAVLRSVAGPDLRIVLTVAECEYRIVARRSAGVFQIADLRGKRVGTPADTSAHFYLVKMLRKAGLAEADVTIVPLAQTAMASALEDGEVAAVSIWEPWAQYAIEGVGGDAVVFADRTLYRERFNLNTTVEVLADASKRAALVDLVRATIRASGQVRRGPAAVAPLLAARIQVNEPTTAAVWRQFRFPASLPRDLLDVMMEEEDWIARAQHRPVRSRSALASLIDRSVLADASKHPEANPQAD